MVSSLLLVFKHLLEINSPKTARFMKSSSKMTLISSLYVIAHNHPSRWLGIFKKATSLQFDLWTVILDQFGLQGRCLIQIVILKNQIAYSFNTSVLLHEIEMFKTATLDGIVKVVCVGRSMMLNCHRLWEETNALMTAWWSSVRKETV